MELTDYQYSWLEQQKPVMDIKLQKRKLLGHHVQKIGSEKVHWQGLSTTQQLDQSGADVSTTGSCHYSFILVIHWHRENSFSYAFFCITPSRFKMLGSIIQLSKHRAYPIL